MTNITQIFEQAPALLKDIAPAMRAYFHRLVLEGFTREEALQLTIAMQNSLVNASKGTN